MRYMWHDPTAYWFMSLLFLGSAAAVVTALAVLLGRRGPTATPAGRPEAEDTLRMRFARGEIDTEEYEHRLAALHATRA